MDLSGGALAVVLAENAASASVSPALAVSTTNAAVAIAAGLAVVPVSSAAKVAALVQGVMKGMMLTKLKTVTVALMGLVAFGGAMATQHTATAQQVVVPQGEKPAIRKTEDPLPKNPPKSLEEEKLHGEWIFTDFKGEFGMTFGPGNKVRVTTGDISDNSDPDNTGIYSVDWSKKPHHLDLKLFSGQKPSFIMEFIEPGKLHIEEVNPSLPVR